MVKALGWITLAVGTSAVACTYSNPDYVEPTEGSSGAVADTGTPTVMTSAMPPDSSSPLDSSGAATTPPETSGDPQSDTTDMPDPTETTGGPPACEFGPAMQVTINPPLEDMDCMSKTPFHFHVEAGNDFVFEVQACLVCPCTELQGDYTLTFDVAAPLVVGSCYTLERDLEAGAGDCFVRGYGIYNGEEAPVQVVSNVPSPGVSHTLSMELAQDPSVMCGQGCDEKMTGLYALSHEDMDIPPNGGPTGFPGGYSVTNHGSGVQDNCTPVYRWHAMWD